MRDSLTGLLAAMMAAVTLFAFAGYQVTGEEAASKLLGRLAASLVELDRWVPSHRDDIQLVAKDRPQEPVLIDDLPVDVLIPSTAALNAGNDELADLLREAMGRRLYQDGRGALQDDEGGTHLPVTEPVRWTVWLLGSGAHGFWRIATIATGLATLGLLASVVISRRSPMMPLLAGGVGAVAGSFFVWLVAGSSGSLFDGAVDREIMLIVRDGAWLGLRNSLAVAVIALAALYLWRTLVEPRREHADDRYRPDIEQSDIYPSDLN
ncbi:MAG TPA: hypothetical protein VI876_00930 [Dehalococcoidia bacterium]|nr:hypothetical protein [Dehalococcoidia bacterium]